MTTGNKAVLPADGGLTAINARCPPGAYVLRSTPVTRLR